MQKIEHIGIAVKNLDQAIEQYTALLGSPPYKTERVEDEGVETAFFRTGASKIELLAATKPDSAIAKFIAKRGEGMHHIAYAVADIRQAIERLQGEGFTLLNDRPKPGADNKEIVFLHPKSAGGVLVELCAEKA